MKFRSVEVLRRGKHAADFQNLQLESPVKNAHVSARMRLAGVRIIAKHWNAHGMFEWFRSSSSGSACKLKSSWADLR